MKTKPCPRCGYPIPENELVFNSIAPGAKLLICNPCAEVELAEFAQLRRVLPFEDWVVND